jgi:hypothetical protein
MLKTGQKEERRRFKRVLFDAPVTLVAGERTYKTTLIDLSLNGALVKKPSDWQSDNDQEVILSTSLDQAGSTIHMGARTAHLSATQIGFACNTIDLESITHLRRLIELNVGDYDLLERELEALN